MARAWPIHVLVLVIFVAETIDCAGTSKNKATDKKTTQQPGMTGTDTEECGVWWRKYGTTYFSFCRCTQPCSFNSAREKCREKQAELAKCHTLQLEKFFMRSLKLSASILLGGSDRDKKGTWRWPDGSLLNDNYTNWYKDEPDGKTCENCLELSTYFNKWYDEPCDHEYSAGYAGFVCEKKV